MPLITRGSIDLNNFSFYADWNAVTRGRSYYAEKRVSIVKFEGESAVCRVVGNSGIYTVSVSGESKNRASFNCSCPAAAKARVCKHMVATALALADYLKTTAENQWEYRLNLALENSPHKARHGTRREKFCLVYLLQREKHGTGEVSFRLIPTKVVLKEWHQPALKSVLDDPEQLNELLVADRTWQYASKPIGSPLDLFSCANASSEAVQVCNLIVRESQNRYYGQYGIQSFSHYLTLLASLDAVIFLSSTRGTIKGRLIVMDTPVTVQAALAREDEALSLQAGLVLGGKIFTTVKDNFSVISRDPSWVLAGEYIVPVENPESLDFMGYFPVVVPQKDERQFRDRYFRQIAERIPVVGEIIQWENVDTEPVPRLYLSDEEHTIRAALRFGYGEQEVTANPKAQAEALIDKPGSWGMVRVQRRLDEEERFYQMLTDARYGLKRAPQGESPGEFELRARTHPFDFLLHSVPLLTKAGFEIFGEEKLKTGRINRAQPRISVSISSGIDWFELEAIVHYGDQQLTLGDLRKAIRKKERYVKLADGSIGKIPDEWLERYRHLLDMAEDTGKGLKLAEFHIPLVDSLLADAELTQAPEDFGARRNRLKNFDSIADVAVPHGFIGELRLYQKAGLNWLHFLREYGFGGCLADDMGLGKTIQVLAFLQSMKELQGAAPATLLVVPKSLLANWQREAERFTPGLRFLEYFGNARNKDTGGFKDYDVIMTTYGTLLRDIELLRSYRFHYAILDESQAIKNPNAQSAKAARLIQADHRLVMTGTPVENNTFELWSQFAFLNPGLLGGMDYFKREFATPIESKASEETSTLLRKMVFPFILRRTKEQVAPELPPRTERIIFTDLDPHQRKLYLQVRDRYRAELSGLIESKGMGDARMKILEGLLRLRQVCIHPLLIDHTYRGGAAKIDLLLETIDTLQSENHKALIFSQFVETLKIIRTELDEREITYAYLDGQTENRQAQVDLFQNDPGIRFFLISLKAGGVGLNLTAADYVIHLDPWWNPAVEMQAADRAHRIGQDKPVFIYKYIARDTVEEKILKLQERKKDLVDQIISAEGSFFKSITAEDVKVLFS